MQFFRRRVEIVTAPGVARGAVEDDFHNMRLEIHHDGGIVTKARGHAVRYPTNYCTAAAGQLRLLEGAKLSERVTDLYGFADQYQQCTHVFELAGVAITTCARGDAHRLYELEIRAVPPDAPTEGVLKRDGKICLSWQVANSIVQSPERYAGLSLRRGFREWIEKNLSPAEAEAAFLMRRGMSLATVHHEIRDKDEEKNEDAMKMAGACFALQRERIPGMTWFADSVRTFSDTPETVGRGDQPWLRFED